ncbi:MAG: YmaF family protein [Bacillota bacterium]
MGYGAGPVNPGHTHRYGGVTTFDFGHIHRYGGVSSAAFGGVDAHTHTLSGTTTFDDGHEHSYSVVTGPGIFAGPGPHVHRYFGITAPAGNDVLQY